MYVWKFQFHVDGEVTIQVLNFYLGIYGPIQVLRYIGTKTNSH